MLISNSCPNHYIWLDRFLCLQMVGFTFINESETHRQKLFEAVLQVCRSIISSSTRTSCKQDIEQEAISSHWNFSQCVLHRFTPLHHSACSSFHTFPSRFPNCVFLSYLSLIIPHISHNRHNRRWCTFFKPAYLFPQRTGKGLLSAKFIQRL